jgi:predicted DNA-binding transcriptional regulator AlpA
VSAILIVNLPRKPASIRLKAVAEYLWIVSNNRGGSKVFSIVDAVNAKCPASPASLSRKTQPIAAASNAKADISGKSDSGTVNQRVVKKAGHTRETAARVAVELAAALALHRAGIDCKVKKSVVCAVKGWSRATLYRRIAEESFPKPTKRDRYSEWRIADVIATP